MIKKSFNALLRFFFKVYNKRVLASNYVKFGDGLIVNGIIYINNQGTLEIGEGVKINSGARFNPIGGQIQTRLIVYPGAKLRIGNNVGISNSTIVAQTAIEIDEGTLIGGSCNIWDTDFHSLDQNIRGTTNDAAKSKPIFIGKKVFLGAHSIVLKGVTIEDYSIVGAGSIVRYNNKKIINNNIKLK